MSVARASLVGQSFPDGAVRGPLRLRCTIEMRLFALALPKKDAVLTGTTRVGALILTRDLHLHTD